METSRQPTEMLEEEVRQFDPADAAEPTLLVATSAGLSPLETVQGFYLALLKEMQDAGYTDAERALLASERLYYGRYLNPRLRTYFEQTVIPQVARGVSFITSDGRSLRILDLGCGLGMQSIILASMGAKVVGLDIRKEAIDLCNKRKAYHERMLGRSLDVQFIHGDFLKARPDDFMHRFDAVFSMAAFSYMEPLERTVALVSAILKDDAKILIYDKNSDHPLHQLRNSPEPGPSKMRDAFTRHGFDQSFLEGGCALPGAFWKFSRLNESVVAPANNLLRKTMRFSFSYVLGFERRARAELDSQAHRIGVLVLCMLEFLPDVLPEITFFAS